MQQEISEDNLKSPSENHPRKQFNPEIVLMGFLLYLRISSSMYRFIFLFLHTYFPSTQCILFSCQKFREKYEIVCYKYFPLNRKRIILKKISQGRNSFVLLYIFPKNGTFVYTRLHLAQLNIMNRNCPTFKLYRSFCSTFYVLRNSLSSSKVACKVSGDESFRTFHGRIEFHRMSLTLMYINSLYALPLII